MSSSSPRVSLDSDDPERKDNKSRPNSRRISYAEDNPRKKAIQFNVGGVANEPHQHRRTPSDKGASDKPTKPSHVEFQEKEPKQGSGVASRGPSPPPPDTYERGVSFNTFDNPDAADFSLTLNYKHKGYQCTRRSRTFLCGIDQNDYSDFALEWLIDELVDDGDEIVCLRAVEKDSTIANDSGIETGSYRKEAEKLFKQVIHKNSQDEKAVSLVLELAVGKIQDIIQRMIRIYEPALLVVGTRGRNLSGMQSLLPGSVSKYCLQQSPIPVIVVRPSTKREKKKKKRMADPSRRSYNNILEMSERRGSHIFNPSSSTDSSNVARLPDEEAAVAKALGLPAPYTNSRTSLSFSDRSSTDDLTSLNAEILKGSRRNSLESNKNEDTLHDSRQEQSEEKENPSGDSNDHGKDSTPRAGSTSPDNTEAESRTASGTTDDSLNIPVIVTDSAKNAGTNE